jgi:hypothetical protein
MKAKIADNIKTGRQGLPGGESTPASAPSSDTAQSDCSIALTDDEDTPIKIENTSNARLDGQKEAE